MRRFAAYALLAFIGGLGGGLGGGLVLAVSDRWLFDVPSELCTEQPEENEVTWL